MVEYESEKQNDEIYERLPVLILWELWVNYTHYKYGNGRPSVPRIIYKIVRNMADCIHRKWPYWDPMPPNWRYILTKAEGFGCGRIVQRANWCRPPRGSMKINWGIGKNNQSCGFFARNSSGNFCRAGIYSVQQGEDLMRRVKVMLQDCISWCKLKGIERVILETDDWRGIAEEEVGSFPPGMRGSWNTCNVRVNCVVLCLVECCRGLNIIFTRQEGLPRSMGRVLALEGIPHFLFAPGIDFV